MHHAAIDIQIQHTESDYEFEYAAAPRSKAYLGMVKWYKMNSNARYFDSLIQTSPTSQKIITISAMQFSMFSVVAFFALATTVIAGGGGDCCKCSGPGGVECKPLLQSCAVNSECCGDLCVLGVSMDNFKFIVYLLTTM